MSSSYVQGLELSSQVQKQISDMEPDVLKHRATVQTWYALSQTWSSLRTALITTAEAADEAVHASKQQRAKYQIYANVAAFSHNFRDDLADACLSHFRYVTELSQYAQTVQQNHESALLRWRYRREQYEGALGPHPNMVRPHHSSFYDALNRDLEELMLSQKLENVYVRWVRLRAAADLKIQAEKFHATCRILKIHKAKADRQRKRAVELRREASRCAKDYKHLEMEVMKARLAIQFVGEFPDNEGEMGLM